MVRGVSDLRGISGAIDWNESYDADTVWQDLFVSNWGSGTSDHAIRLSHSGSSSEHTLRRILFDGGGSLFRTNATSIGTYLIDSSATVFGKTDTDRVLIDAGSSITLRLTNNAFRCSDYSVDDDGGITVSEDSGNVYESQGNGYTHPTPANTIGIPSESQVNATNAGNVSYDSPTGPLSAMRESVLKILSVSTGDGMLSLLSPKKEGAIADPVWPSIFGAIKTPIH